MAGVQAVQPQHSLLRHSQPSCPCSSKARAVQKHTSDRDQPTYPVERGDIRLAQRAQRRHLSLHSVEPGRQGQGSRHRCSWAQPSDSSLPSQHSQWPTGQKRLRQSLLNSWLQLPAKLNSPQQAVLNLAPVAPRRLAQPLGLLQLCLVRKGWDVIG